MSSTDYREVLDHGYVRLIDYMGSDLSIVRNARVSHDAEWRAGEDTGSDARLINYLYKNKHNTPFESVVFTFEVKAPIFVIRQWHRHRTWSYNEVSARYTQLPSEYYVPLPEHVGEQDGKNHQSRNFVAGQSVPELALHTCEAFTDYNKETFRLYQALLDAKVPRELARTVLPLSTYTRMFATVNLHNLFRFLDERASPHAQYEIRVYAEALGELIQPIIPVAFGAYLKERQERIQYLQWRDGDGGQ